MIKKTKKETEKTFWDWQFNIPLGADQYIKMNPLRLIILSIVVILLIILPGKEKQKNSKSYEFMGDLQIRKIIARVDSKTDEYGNLPIKVYSNGDRLEFFSLENSLDELEEVKIFTTIDTFNYFGNDIPLFFKQIHNLVLIGIIDKKLEKYKALLDSFDNNNSSYGNFKYKDRAIEYSNFGEVDYKGLWWDFKDIRIKTKEGIYSYYDDQLLGDAYADLKELYESKYEEMRELEEEKIERQLREESVTRKKEKKTAESITKDFLGIK